MGTKSEAIPSAYIVYRGVNIVKKIFIPKTTGNRIFFGQAPAPLIFLYPSKATNKAGYPFICLIGRD